MARNVYSVPKKQWSKWSYEAQAIFNRSYHFFINNKDNMVHPEAPEIPSKFWRTTAWNAAWIAADSYDNVVPNVVV